ncbi:protein mono-ADP-ribosyltransferase PARP12-like isoform X2 [Gadus morhua]|uniref:protein mono-ADP-ribosyltransferase PARP12-like isoform X2 n=1 Tax=Gadus morhua TaxID=8049 RepID=UPI0011B5B537|nr:protein mono-ADP-ribosyltransferase PARP12-like isoform X2 [Gadus morhua]
MASAARRVRRRNTLPAQLPSHPYITEICLFFLEGSCIHPIGECCGAHYRLPYSWEVLEGHQWTLLESSEEIEEDYCNPQKTYSTVDVEAVCFDTMTRGLQKVRRLSSISSVLQPTFLLTTEWLWYWKDENGNWYQYDSPPNSSTELEQKFQNDPQEVVEFTAGSQTYTLSLQDMIQTNKTYGTKRRVRRRPRFLSPGVVQVIRARNGPPNVQPFPNHWDKTQVPDIGYKKVLLQDSSEEYKEVETLFRQTMTTFDIVKIERIQNKTLWDKFQLQREQMKMRNGGRYVAERKLFHGTDSKFINAICSSNFDWRICGTHGTAYGNGSYFARDASYSHHFTGNASTVRSMFVSQVLVGDHTRGSAGYMRPPSKDGGDPLSKGALSRRTFYDSCVDDIHSPSIFVVFDRPQIYPEFLLSYK